jgi:hypothetical protein
VHGISIQASFILKLYSANDVTVEAVAERMSLLDYVNALGDWVLANLDKIVFSAVTIAVVYVFIGLQSEK